MGVYASALYAASDYFLYRLTTSQIQRLWESKAATKVGLACSRHQCSEAIISITTVWLPGNKMGWCLENLAQPLLACLLLLINCCHLGMGGRARACWIVLDSARLSPLLNVTSPLPKAYNWTCLYINLPVSCGASVVNTSPVIGSFRHRQFCAKQNIRALTCRNFV